MEQWLSKAAPPAKGKAELRDQVATLRAEIGAKDPDPPPPPSSRRRIAAASPYKGVQFGAPAASAAKPAPSKPAAPARTATVAGVGVQRPRRRPWRSTCPPSLERIPAPQAQPATAFSIRFGPEPVRFGPPPDLTPLPPPVAPAAPPTLRRDGHPAALAAAPSGPHGDDARHRARDDRAGAPPRAPARAAARRGSGRARPRAAAGEPWPRARRAGPARRRPLRAPAGGLPCSPAVTTGGDTSQPAPAVVRFGPPPAAAPAPTPAPAPAAFLPATPQPAPAAQPPPPPRLSIPEPPPRRPPLPSLLTIGPGRRSLSTFGTIVVSAFTATAVVSLALYLFVHRDKGAAGAASASASAAPGPPPRPFAPPRLSPSASASAAANPADLPFGFGYLTIVSPAKANVYVSGKLAGPVNKALKVRCGRWFIRLAAPQEGHTPSG